MRRVALFVTVFWIAYFLILVAAGMVQGMAPPPFRQMAWGTASAAALIALSAAFLRLERRSASEVGLDLHASSLVRLLAGCAIGAGMYGAHLLVVRAVVGGLHFVPGEGATAAAIATAAGTFAALSCMEELGFRGYPLRRLEATVGLWPALLIAALVFAASHVAFGWPWYKVLLGVVPGGLLFGMAAIASRGLALPIGLHAAWNFASWAAGEKDATGIWQIAIAESDTGRAALVGSASFVTIFLGATLAFWWWHRGRTTGPAAGTARKAT